MVEKKMGGEEEEENEDREESDEGEKSGISSRCSDTGCTSSCRSRKKRTSRLHFCP